MKNSYKISKCFIFRCAGFPFELIEKIKFGYTYQAIGRCLEKGGSNSRVQSAREIYDEELYRKRLQLQEIACSEKFQEAVFHQNQNNYHNDVYEYLMKNFASQKIKANMRNYNSRHKEQLIYRYLQRFCTKNETVSFFGPFYIGKFGNSKKNILIKRNGIKKIRNRKVYISTWLLKGILDRIILDDEIFKMLKPRLVPRIHLDGLQAIDMINGRKNKLDRIALKILRLAELGYNVAEISLGLSRAEIKKEKNFDKIRLLIKNGILLSGLETEAKRDEPDTDLIDELSNIPAAKRNDWYARLKRLSQLRSKFEKGNFAGRLQIAAELKELFLPLFSEPESKNIEGEKGFFTEYCESNIDQLRLGMNIRRDLQNYLSFILNLASYNKMKINKIKSSLLRSWLNNKFKSREINIKDAILLIAKNLGGRGHLFKFGNKDFLKVIGDGFPSKFLNLIDQDKQSRLLRFKKGDLEKQFDAYVDKIDGVAGTCCDVFISSLSNKAINKGDYKIVFGESHVMRKPLSIYRWMVETPSGGADLIKEIKNIHKSIGKHYTLGEFTTIPKDALSRAYDFSTIREIESDLYSEKKNNKLSLSELKLSWDDNSISAIEPGRKMPVLLLDHLPAISPVSSILSSNISNRRFSKGKAHFPRVEIDKFVIQREQWVFLRNELFFAQKPYNKKGVGLWIELEEWRRKENIPEQFFLKVGEDNSKPFFIDFENYFAIEVFMNFIKRDNEKLWIIEMLPGPEDLWFKDNEGRYTSEFRLILHRSF